MQIPDRPVVGFQGLPGWACGKGLDACCHFRLPFAGNPKCESTAWDFGCSLAYFEFGVVSSQSRNPPRNALALSPALQWGGSTFNFLTFPPPKTTSSGSSAAIRRATTSATCWDHF